MLFSGITKMNVSDAKPNKLIKGSQITLQSWTIKQGVGSLMLAVIVDFGALTAFLLYRQVVASAEMQDLYEEDYRVAATIGEVDGLQTRIDINILRMVAIGNPTTIAAWKAENDGRRAKVDAQLEVLKKSANDGSKADITQLATAYVALRDGMANQVKAIEAGELKSAGDINRAQVKDNADKVFSALEKLKLARDTMAKTKVEARLSAVAATRALSIAVVLCVAIGAAALTLLVLRSLLRQLGGEPGWRHHERSRDGHPTRDRHHGRDQQRQRRAKCGRGASGRSGGSDGPGHAAKRSAGGAKRGRGREPQGPGTATGAGGGGVQAAGEMRLLVPRLAMYRLWFLGQTRTCRSGLPAAMTCSTGA
jgi:hypothetical protein